MDEPKTNSNCGRHALAAGLAGCLAFVVHFACFRTWTRFHTSIDFNQGPFEDFTGPYYRQALAMGEDGRLQDWFLYPPSFALFLSPLGSVPAPAAAWIWLVALSLATITLAWVGLTFIRKPRPVTTFLFCLCFGLGIPWVHDMHWGQVSTLLWAWTLLGLRLWCKAWQPGCPARTALWAQWGAAVCLSLAIAIKMFPAWFLLAFVARKDWKGIARVGGFSVLWLGILPLTFMGAVKTERFYRDLFAGWDTAFEKLFWGSEGSQFAPNLLNRLWQEPSGILGVLVWGLPYALATCILWQSARCLRAGGLTVGLVLVASTLPMVLSPSWLHYLVWLPWGIFAMAQAFPSLGIRALLAMAACLMSTPFFLLVGGHPEYASSGWLALASLCVPLAYFLGGGVDGMQRVPKEESGLHPSV